MLDKFIEHNSASKLHMEEVTRSFGRLLLKLRSALGKKRKDIAFEISITDNPVFQWENGTSFPEESRLPDIAKAYGIDLEKLTEAFKISKGAHQKDAHIIREIRTTNRRLH